MSSNAPSTAGNQEASIQQGTTRIKYLDQPLRCMAKDLDRTCETNMGGKVLTVVPQMVESFQHKLQSHRWLKHSKKILREVEFPECDSH